MHVDFMRLSRCQRQIFVGWEKSVLRPFMLQHWKDDPMQQSIELQVEIVVMSWQLEDAYMEIEAFEGLWCCDPSVFSQIFYSLTD
ncbi:hypothetical protein MLD38_003828 [Melastoma candidum]|uniref:Uncharacterized protein n=1 Tax=Melastoma candidum TaxID=119954 RepID=A0ACB9SCB1_9MYRT|nr:hypothetical protein MLD38_003828 [Melastoma candidum]